MTETVPEMLRECAETYEARSPFYGDSYKTFGRVMRELFPGNAIKLNTVDDFNRYSVLVMIVGKLIRYCENMDKGGHDDSLLDLAVYSQMLRELDEEIRSTSCPL